MTTDSDLVKRLRTGSLWLRDQSALYYDGDSDAADDDIFSEMLDVWDTLVLDLYRARKYKGCIFGEARCPEDSVVFCEACKPYTTQTDMKI